MPEVALPKSIVRDAVVASSAYAALSSLVSFDDVYEAIVRMRSLPAPAPPDTPRTAPADNGGRAPPCANCGAVDTEWDRQGYHVCRGCGACLARVVSDWTPPPAPAAPKKRRRADERQHRDDATKRRAVPSAGPSARDARHDGAVRHWATLAGLPVGAAAQACAAVSHFAIHSHDVTLAAIVAAIVLAVTPLPVAADLEARMRRREPLEALAPAPREAPRFPCPACGERAFSKRDARFHCRVPHSSMAAGSMTSS